MQLTYFKTYSSTSVRKAIEKLQLNTLDFSGLKKQERNSRESSQFISLKTFSSKLNQRIVQNRNKLSRNPTSKSRLRIRPEVLEALLGSERELQSCEVNIKSLPLKRYSNQDAFRLRDRKINVLKYLGNDRDPYFQLRHNHYLVVRS